MPFVNPKTPNLPDFLTFLADQVQIPSSALPDDSPYPGYALDAAIGLVLLPPACPVPVLYTLAVYNGATHLLFTITPDQQGQTYFANARSPQGFGLAAPSTGLVVATFDEGTGTTLAEPEWAKGLTVNQLGYFKTPWGREYLSWQQSFGPTIVGLT
jgi:hypothetical protein